MADERFPRIGSFRKFEDFRSHLQSIDPEVPVDENILDATASPLAKGFDGTRLAPGNRWVIHPMEGWDGTENGRPTELTLRRWRNFGESGAKLIWGGEAVAVRRDGRANPNQLYAAEHNLKGLDELRRALIDAHLSRFGAGSDKDLVLGLQLTHSGRFARPEPDNAPAPRVAFRHPILDKRVGIDDDAAVLSDSEVDGLIEDFVSAAKSAAELGYHFVDVKHCHGYLLHEFLGGHTREGRFGGSFENRTRILREIVSGIRRDAPGLEVGVRVSIFDMVPFRPDPARSQDKLKGPGIPEDLAEALPYRYGFGVNENDPTVIDLHEGVRFLELLRELDIQWVNISGGSPYYNPHIQRPALYPPSDGYQPPEDPLLGVTRQLQAIRKLKEAFPDLVLIGSALSYLQDYLPNVAQATVREGWMDAVGLGRMVLSYWDLPADTLEGKALQRKKLCRTFSDCTTAPRNRLVSGCYPLDPFYRTRPEATTLRDIKKG